MRRGLRTSKPNNTPLDTPRCGPVSSHRHGETFKRRITAAKNTTKPTQEKRWATNLIHSLWDFAMKLWKKQLQQVHDKNKTVPPHRQALINQIRILYTKIGKVPNILAGLFKHDVNKLLGKPTKYLTRWLRIATKVPLNEQVTKKRRTKFGQDIRKYLPMATKPPDHNKYITRTDTGQTKWTPK